MSAKVALLVVAVLVIFQALTWQTDASVVRREVESEAPKIEGLEEATKQLQDAFAEFKTKMESLAADIQNDPFVKNITQTIQAQAASLTGSATTK